MLASPLVADETLVLRDNLRLAQKGDYIVTAQGKMATLLHIHDRTPTTLTIEEISLPLTQKNSKMSWKEWLRQGGLGNTAWVFYGVELTTGRMQYCYSKTRASWIEISKADSFLSTLLNLSLQSVPVWQRKKAGPPPLPGMPDRRPLWQPRMVVEGVELRGVSFGVWRTRWPKDGSLLSDKSVEVYLPQESAKYPAYFPYWLQISGMIGKAQIFIIDSGHQMTSPASLPRISK